MNRQDFTGLLDAAHASIKALNTTKGKNYAGDEDALSNFKRSAARLNLTPPMTDILCKFWPTYLSTSQPQNTFDVHFQALQNRVANVRGISIDCETQAPTGGRDKDALDLRVTDLVGVSLSWKENEYTPWPDAMPGDPPIDKTGAMYPSIYLPFKHALVPEMPSRVLEWFASVLADEHKVKIFHFAPFDVPVFKWRKGWPTKPPYLDTALFAWVYDETLPRGLKELMAHLLGWQPLDFTSIAKVPFGSLPPNVAYPYACQDVYGPLRLLEFFTKNLHPGGLELVRDLETPIQEILMQMHFEGIPIDVHLLHRYEAAVKEIVAAVDAEVKAHLGSGVNVNAFKQLLAAFRDIGINLVSTGAETLRRVNHPAAQSVLQYRKFKVVLGTFIQGLEKELWPDGKIHPRFLQWYYEEKGKRGSGARTGRGSSRNPNAQNVPRKPLKVPQNLRLSKSTSDLEEINLRSLWATPDGESFTKADSSQIEPRTTAMTTGEPLLLDIFNAPGKSVYKEIGKMAMAQAGQPVDNIQKGTVLYELFKTTVLGIGYGAFPDTIQEQMEKNDVWVGLEKVQEIHAMVTSVLPTVTQVHPIKVAGFAQRDGYVETVFGRRLHLPNFHPRDRGMIRRAVNFQIGQSPAFDIMKRAMIQVRDQLKAAGLKSRMCLQIHDEIGVIGPDHEVPQVARILYDALCNPAHTERFSWRVPLDAEVAVGKRYGALVEYKLGQDGVPWEDQPNALDAQPKNPKEVYLSLVQETLPCRKCDHFAPFGWRKVGVSGQLAGPIDVLWLGANPGIDEVEAHEPFVGRSGRTLRQLAYDARLPVPPMPGAMFANALWCFSNGTDGILAAHINNCRPHLDRILDLVRPRVVISLGGVASRSILRLGAEYSVEAHAGEWADLPIGCKVLQTFHPAFLLRSPGFTGAFIDHLGSARIMLDSLRVPAGVV